ncbi:hypothetical protein MMC19_005430 [Ptychographa xylographoides]|nr:hypothetical protein [Ptychographa xylographoides]
MNPTTALRAAHRVPLIKFIGKRTPPKSIDHTPTAHPASPTHSLPDSFAAYRSKAQQHGPLGGSQSLNAPSQSSPSSPLTPSPTVAYAYGAIGGHTGHSLGSVEPSQGTYFDRSELPVKFRRTPWSQAEIDAIESGGASMWS